MKTNLLFSIYSFQFSNNQNHSAKRKDFAIDFYSFLFVCVIVRSEKLKARQVCIKKKQN